jgi:hypothetical protein
MTADRHNPAAQRRVAVLQSNYIPWKGYFDLIAAVDVFVLYDQMQYTREDWRNRNIIKAPQGPQWLTVPVLQKGRFGQRICDTEIDGSNWARKHWKSIEGSYRKAPHFAEVAAVLEPIYLGETYRHLSQLNRRLIEAICRHLGIGTRIVDSGEFVLEGDRSERVAGICSHLQATSYISGPAARSYLDEAAFTARNIAVEWFEYGGYPTYRQLWGDFTHQVSIVDLLVHCGPSAGEYMKLGSRQPAHAGAAQASQPGPGASS